MSGRSGAEIARPAPPGGEWNSSLCTFARSISSGTEHLTHALAGISSLLRGLRSRRQGIDHGLIPLLGLAALLDAVERRPDSLCHVLRRGVLFARQGG